MNVGVVEHMENQMQHQMVPQNWDGFPLMELMAGILCVTVVILKVIRSWTSSERTGRT